MHNYPKETPIANVANWRSNNKGWESCLDDFISIEQRVLMREKISH
jgi:hypothetical protein